MKKILTLLIWFSFIFNVAPLVGQDEYDINKNEDTNTNKECDIIYSSEQNASIIKRVKNNYEITNIPKIENVLTIKEQKQNEFNSKLNLLDCSDKMQWFINYKNLTQEYSEWIEPEKSIYDCFSYDELWFLFQIVEAEVTGEKNFIPKVNAVSSIYNRLYIDYNNKFPDTITEILKQPKQYSTFSDGRYLKVKVTNTTILACEYAFQIENTAQGAYFFDSCKGASWAAKNKKFLFTDAVGHSFYK